MQLIFSLISTIYLVPELELILYQFVVGSPPFYQFAMCSMFGNLSFIQYHYLIGILYGA